MKNELQLKKGKKGASHTVIYVSAVATRSWSRPLDSSDAEASGSWKVLAEQGLAVLLSLAGSRRISLLDNSLVAQDLDQQKVILTPSQNTG
jgi:chitinase